MKSSKGAHFSINFSSMQEEVRLTVSVLFKFLRKDLADEKLSRDLRIWLDRAISVGKFLLQYLW